MVQKSAYTDTETHADECALAFLVHLIKEVSLSVASNMN